MDSLVVGRQVSGTDILLGAIIGDARPSAPGPRPGDLVSDVIGHVEPIRHASGLAAWGDDQGRWLPFQPSQRRGGVFQARTLVPAGRRGRDQRLKDPERTRRPLRLGPVAPSMADRLKETDRDAQAGGHQFGPPGSAFFAFFPLVLVSPSPSTSFLARSLSNSTVWLSPTPNALAAAVA